MPNIPFATWIANAAVGLPGLYGDVTRQAGLADCSRQTIYDHAHKVQAAVVDAHDGGPTRAALIAENQRLARENAQLWQWLEETIEFIRRDVLNLAMRNTDNHARNTAVHTVDGVTRLTPLFDFAPMYLDPEGITRAARWYHLETGKELRRWNDILRQLALPAQEQRQLVEALVRFGEKLATLADCMRDAGVDADIVDFVTPGIAAQRAQLLALRST